MTELAIRATNISKQYHIGSLRRSELTLQERVLQGIAKPFRRARGLMSGRSDAAADLDQSFWALRDVSFSINQGERVAIVGRNGAGKSTLLKILSRITEPTTGSAVLHGRLGSLLEVGTGFHAELTGRDNVFLNGSILGMRESEVRAKFDEIVAFAEVEQFIDTPVKHYSSGMRVRLAFAVAAHLEPELLIVDEVLSVGDVAFRKKCMDQMRKVTSRGATMLLVSHNAQTVISMCDRAIWLERGQIVQDGPAAETIQQYLGQGLGLEAARTWPEDARPGGDIARLRSIRIVTEKGVTTDCIDVRDRFCVESVVEVLVPGYGLVVKNELFGGDGTQVLSSLDIDNPVWKNRAWPVGTYTLRMWVPANFLQIDTFTIGVVIWAWEPRQVLQCNERTALCFHVIDEFDGSSARAGFIGHMHGVVRPILKWDMEPNLQVSPNDGHVDRAAGNEASMSRTREGAAPERLAHARRSLF